MMYLFVWQEQELYQRESLGVGEVEFMDNQDCIGEGGEGGEGGREGGREREKCTRRER